MLFLRDEQIDVEVPEALVAAGVAALGLLMVSAIPYRSFKEIDLRHSYRAIVVMVLVLALIVQEPQISIFVIGAALRALGTGRVGLAHDLRQSAREAAAAAAAGEPSQETTS